MSVAQEIDCHFELDERKVTSSYRRYLVKSVKDPPNCAGFILFELCGSTWNLELMTVVPPNRGIGSALLKYTLEREGLVPKDMTVCPIDEHAKRFFKRHAFDVDRYSF